MKDKINYLIKNVRQKTYLFLRWTERWTKTDMVYLTKGGFWLLTFEAITLLGVFITTVFFANFVTKEEYGIYKYLISLAGILNAFSLTGMNTAVTKSVAKGFQGSLRQSFWVQIKWNVLITIISLSIALYYLLVDKNLPIFLGLIIIGLFFPILYSANTFSAYLSGVKDFKKIFRYNTSINFCSSLLTIIGIMVFPNALFLILIYFVLNTAANLICYLLVVKKYKPNNSFEPSTISYGKHLSAMNFLGVIANNFDKILTFNLFGPAQLAIYNFAIAMPDQIRGAFKVIPAVALPKIATNELILIDKNFIKKIVKLTIASSLLIVIYILLTPFIYQIFFPQYKDSIILSQVFAISLIFVMPTMPLISFLQAKEKTRVLYRYNIFSASIQIVGIAIFGYFSGLIGIMVAKIICSILSLIYILYLVKK